MVNYPKYQIKKSVNSQFYWVLFASNVEPILTSSEQYVSKQGCQTSIASSKKNVADGNFKRLKATSGQYYFLQVAGNYCTFTTRYQLTLPAARKSMERLHSHLSFHFAFSPKIFWVAEPFDIKYGCHLHALIEVENKKLTTKTDIRNAWQVVSKGKGLKEYNNTTIKDYDRLKGGHFYLSKYLQSHKADYDLL